MKENKNTNPTKDRLADAYGSMLERASGSLKRAEKETLPVLRKLVQGASEKAVELGELTLDESEKIGQYLIRDIEDATHFLAETNNSLGEWLRFDLEYIEDKVLDMMQGMVNHTQLELDRIAEQARESDQEGLWRTGEIAGIGTLHCIECGRELNYHKPGRVPPCPKCHATIFVREPERVSSESDH